MVEGISHITFLVKDLELATNFFMKIFDAEEIYSSRSMQFSLSPEKYFMIGNIWICIMVGESSPTKTYNHCAFKISESDFPIYVERIKLLGLDIRQGRPRIEGEGLSIYFYDFDNHLFELHTGNITDRLERYLNYV